MYEPAIGVTGGRRFYSKDEDVVSEEACKLACNEDLSCDAVMTLPTDGNFTCQYYKDEHLQVEMTSEPYTLWTKRCPHGENFTFLFPLLT